jgi:polysaccharide pyruvyl transferase WcaK-like protein/pyruvate-formate lyase-activating enzyme
VVEFGTAEQQMHALNIITFPYIMIVSSLNAGMVHNFDFQVRDRKSGFEIRVGVKSYEGCRMKPPKIQIYFYDKGSLPDKDISCVPIERKIIREDKRIIFAHDFQCNVRCNFCRAYHIKNRMDVVNALDDMIADTMLPLCEGAEIVELGSVGEPLASAHSRKLGYEISKQYPDIQFCIHSNGILFNNKNYWRAGLGERLHTLYIWLNAATEKTYMRIVRDGNFRKVLKNLRFASSLKRSGKITNFYLASVVTPANRAEKRNFIRLAEQYNAEPYFVSIKPEQHPSVQRIVAAIQTYFVPVKPERRPCSGISMPKIKSAADNAPSYLIFPPTQGYGSFGDQAMMFATIKSLRTRHPSCGIGILHYEKIDAFLNEYFPDIQNFHLALEYERTNKESVERYYDALEQYEQVLFIGADNLDGAYNVAQVQTYLNLIRMARKRGKKTVLIGFSYNASPRLKATEYLKEMSDYTTLRIRDQVSLDRLNAHGVKNLVPVADSAFLFNHHDYKINAKTAIYLDALKKETKKYIGFNIRFSKGETEHANQIIKKITSVFCETLDKNEYAFILITHDTRDFPFQYSDTESLSLLGDALRCSGFTVYNPDWINTCIESRAIIELCDFVVGNRMHLAVLAFSLGKPAISFIYQGKFEGLYQFYQFEHSFLFDKDTFLETELAFAVSYIKNNLSRLNEHINKKTKTIIELAQKNFE